MDDQELRVIKLAQLNHHHVLQNIEDDVIVDDDAQPRNDFSDREQPSLSQVQYNLEDNGREPSWLRMWLQTSMKSIQDRDFSSRESFEDDSYDGFDHNSYVARSQRYMYQYSSKRIIDGGKTDYHDSQFDLEHEIYKNMNPSITKGSRKFESQSSQRQQEQQQSTRPEPVPSTPGAFQMMGANVTGRVGVGMITPSDVVAEKTQKFSSKIDATTTETTTDDTCSKDGITSAESGFNFHGDISVRSLTLSINDVLQPQQKSFFGCFGTNVQGRKQRRIRFIVLGTGMLFAIVFFGALIRQLSSSSSRKRRNRRSSLVLVQHWKDLIKECQKLGYVDLSLMHETAVSAYKNHTLEFIKTTTDLPLDEVFVYSNRNETCTPQHLALLSISLHHNKTNERPVSELFTSARYALSVAFFALGGTNWHIRNHWLSENHECQWDLVYCNNNTEVEKLQLHNNQLVGTLPTEIYTLTSMTQLVLINNDITGPLSPDILNLTSLVSLDAQDTQISGPIPTEMYSMPHLLGLGLPKSSVDRPLSPLEFEALAPHIERLVLDAKHFADSLPSDLGRLTKLKDLEIRSGLTGTIPTEILMLPQMHRLYVEPGLLSGTFPTDFFTFNKNWREVTLRENQIEGTIPASVGSQSMLEIFDAASNLFTGSIPTEIGNCSTLRALHFSHNKLTGTIPTELGRTNAMEYMRLDINLLTGTIPTELANMTKLMVFDVSDCLGLVGDVPPTICSNGVSLNVFFAACSEGKGDLSISCGQVECCTSDHGAAVAKEIYGGPGLG